MVTLKPGGTSVVGGGVYEYQGHRVALSSVRNPHGRWVCKFTIVPVGKSIAIERLLVNGDYATRSMAQDAALAEAKQLINGGGS